MNPPEQAIQCFESWSRTRVTLYDRDGEFNLRLEPERFSHRIDACRLGKTRDQRRCVAFDVDLLAREIWNHRDGVLKICHQGLLEWVMPVCRHGDGRLLAILTAGWRVPPEGALPLPCLCDRDRPPPPGPAADGKELALVMEGLRQLAARLAAWHAAESNPGVPPERGEAIHRFLRRNCRRNIGVTDLARALHLSPSRTIHVVRETTGRNFKSLLTAYRLRLAATQLQATDLPVETIARACGFGDPATFHRAFKRHFSQAPRRYRVTPVR